MGVGVEPILLYVSVEFEVVGKVQGLGFTKHCRDNCMAKGIKGWVKNTKTGTIQGKMQGPKAAIDTMVDWLTNTGSPGCKIERCDTKLWGTTARLDFKDFQIRF